MRRRRSLTLALIGQQVASLVILLVVLGITQFVVLRQVLISQTARSLNDELSVLAPLLHRSIVKKTFVSLIPVLFKRFRAPGVQVMLANPKGLVIGSTATFPSNVVPPLPPKGGYVIWANNVVAGTPMHYHGQFLGNIWLLTSLTPLENILFKDIEIYGLAALFVLGVVAVLGAWSVRRTLSPLEQIIGTTEHIAAGDFGRQARVADAPEELMRLGEAVNRMSQAISQAFSAERAAHEEMRRFLADASHELRTPLAAVSGFLELWQAGGLSPAEEAQGLLAMRRETARMTRLVSQLLALSRLDAAPGQEIRPEPVRLDRWLETMLPAWRGLVGDRVVLRTRPVTAVVDPDRLAEVVMNLLDNAARYGGPDGAIVVAIGPGPLGARLEVIDEGPGFPPEVLEHLFERFWRGHEARRQNAAGAGLGLALVKAVVEAHGGRVTATNAPHGGARVIVDLPGPGAPASRPDAPADGA
jgi:two-component system OmpR family sensor kinase